MNRLNLGSSQEKCFVTKETSITAVPADTAVQTPTVLTGESVGRQTVVVMCQCDPRHQGIESIIAKCGGIAYPVEGPGKAIPNSWPPGSHILIIALEDENDARGSVLATIQAFKQRRFKIVAFADGLERWALRSRCHVLVAGASHLLDSARPEFGGKLRCVLRQLLGDEVARMAHEGQMRETMARLGVVGCSEEMAAVFRRLARIGPLSDLPVLVTGETGTGKELLAHAIHALDPKRCKGPFIPVNCAALSPTLAESELFGHRRGTFTGAERDRKGLIRAAHGGVLFLDEIGDLSLELQPKLLRVLQENRVLTLGDEEEVPVSVRVIAATNQDLRELTERRRFRADLFQRLNVLLLRVPSLRERPCDVEPLACHFLAKHRQLHGDDPLETTSDFFEALSVLELPGNVRQLENLVREAIVNKRSGMPLALSDLPAEIWLQLCEPKGLSPLPGVQCQEANPDASQAMQLGTEDSPMWERLLETHRGNLVNCLRACERALLSAMLQKAHGNQSQMARLMGITARSVYTKMRKYGLQS